MLKQVDGTDLSNLCDILATKNDGKYSATDIRR